MFNYFNVSLQNTNYNWMNESINSNNKTYILQWVAGLQYSHSAGTS